MVLINRVKKTTLICAALLLIAQQGCASKPVKSPILAQPGLSEEKIGLVIKRAPQGETLKMPTKEVTGSMGRGAYAGASIMEDCMRSSSLTGLFFCIPTALVFGSVGALDGWVHSEAASKWEDAEAIFRACLTEQDFGHLLETRLIPFAQETGCPLRSINMIETSVNEPIDYKNLPEEGNGLVLELSEVTIRLREAGMSINNPFLSFLTSVHAKVFRTTDGTLLDDRIIVDDMGEARTRDDWALNNGTAFREELLRYI
jgi:hypothetical protein